MKINRIILAYLIGASTFTSFATSEESKLNPKEITQALNCAVSFEDNEIVTYNDIGRCIKNQLYDLFPNMKSYQTINVMYNDKYYIVCIVKQPGESLKPVIFDITKDYQKLLKKSSKESKQQVKEAIKKQIIINE